MLVARALLCKVFWMFYVHCLVARVFYFLYSYLLTLFFKLHCHPVARVLLCSCWSVLNSILIIVSPQIMEWMCRSSIHLLFSSCCLCDCMYRHSSVCFCGSVCICPHPSVWVPLLHLLSALMSLFNAICSVWKIHCHVFGRGSSRCSVPVASRSSPVPWWTAGGN